MCRPILSNTSRTVLAANVTLQTGLQLQTWLHRFTAANATLHGFTAANGNLQTQGFSCKRDLISTHRFTAANVTLKTEVDSCKSVLCSDKTWQPQLWQRSPTLPPPSPILPSNAHCSTPSPPTPSRPLLLPSKNIFFTRVYQSSLYFQKQKQKGKKSEPRFTANILKQEIGAHTTIQLNFIAKCQGSCAGS